MTMNRRAFLGTSTALAVTPYDGGRSLLLGSPGRLIPGIPLEGAPDGVITLRDPKVKALAMTALDAARSAGATYADVRLTYTTLRYYDGRFAPPTAYQIIIGMAVRALNQGYWGWAATPYLSQQEAPRIGREAANLAKLGASHGPPRTVEWGGLGAFRNGNWRTPIRIDPFETPIEELADFCEGIELFIQNKGRPFVRRTRCSVSFKKQERVLASTEGNYLTQMVYTTNFGGSFTYKNQGADISLPEAQGGWDYVLEAKIPERVLAEIDRIDRLPPPLPTKYHLDRGRYDIVFTAPAVAAILEKTLIPATELDRAIGYEANADGTSYLGPDPLTQLGTSVASPLITLTADRSNPHGLRTIRWDDDGVAPEDFTLIKDGVLIDYQTNREQAPWLTPWYQKQGRAVRSHGCAHADDALTYSMQTTPNVTLQPGTEALGLEDLIARMDTGLVVDGMNVKIDFQCSTGVGFIGGDNGAIYEVRQGRRVAEYERVDRDRTVVRTVMFRSADLWKGVLAIGGVASVEHGRRSGHKGEPQQDYDYSLATVPILVKQQTVTEVR